jgi:RNA polymerase sigma factor (TIGR02999 family)
MRRILVDHAREKKSHKRGGDWTKVPLEDNVAEDAHGSVLDVLALDQILQRLSEEQPRPASVVEMRVFGGLTMREIAHVLGVSRRTVTEDWNTARARLSAELSEEATEDPHPLLAEGAMSRWAHHVLEARERAREEADPTAPDQE